MTEGEMIMQWLRDRGYNVREESCLEDVMPLFNIALQRKLNPGRSPVRSGIIVRRFERFRL